MTIPEKRSCLDLIKPYVPGKPVEEVERELGLKDVIKLASNENVLGPSPRALRALRENIERINYYPDGNCFYLKQRLAEKLGLEPEQLVVGNGSDELLTLLAMVYINPGDEAVTVRPTFSEYEFAMSLMGGVIRHVPLTGDTFSYDFEGIARSINERTRIVFICSPNNPTGSVISSDALERFLDRLPSGILVVLDQAYIEYVDDPGHPGGIDYIMQGRPVVVLRTFSKIYGLAGLRIGYGAAQSAVVAALNCVREPFTVNAMAQAGALAALDDLEHVERSRCLVAEGRRQLAAGLAEMGLAPVPSQGNFCFVDLKVDAAQVFQALLRRGIIVRSGEIFGHPTFIRVTCGTAEQNSRFLKEISGVLSEIRG